MLSIIKAIKYVSSGGKSRKIYFLESAVGLPFTRHTSGMSAHLESAKKFLNLQLEAEKFVPAVCVCVFHQCKVDLCSLLLSLHPLFGQPGKPQATTTNGL